MKILSKWFIVTITMITLSQLCFSRTYHITDYGAIADKHTINTSAIQKAIDAANAADGGEVIIPAGIFLSGTIILKSNVSLHLQKGAVLMGSANLDDYPEMIPEYRSYTDRYVTRSLIYAEKQNNISIRGEGTIDGNGGNENFQFNNDSEDTRRPYNIRIISCSRILIENVNLINSAFWMQHYLNCDHLRIEGIRVHNHVNRNNDGMDIDGCKDVIINNCIFDTDDDALCLKATGTTDCENIVISNCLIRTNCTGFKMGTESLGGFKNIVVSNLVMERASKPSGAYNGRNRLIAGIDLLCVDGGHMDNIIIDNVIMHHVQAALFIKLGNRGRKPYEAAPEPLPGSIKNISISNIISHDGDAETSHISGFPGHYIENVSLQNIQLFCWGGGKKEAITTELPEREKEYPRLYAHGKWYPSYGLFARHVKGLTLNNVSFTYDLPEERPVVFCENVEDLKLYNIKAKEESSMEQLYFLKDVRNALISQSYWNRKTRKFATITGNSSNIVFQGIVGLRKGDVNGKAMIE